MDSCSQCEDHAKMHSGNVFGFGPANDPCEPCEQHAKMHASDSCLFVIVTVATVAAAIRLGRARLR